MRLRRCPTSDITGAARLHRAASVLMDGLGHMAIDLDAVDGEEPCDGKDTTKKN